MMKDDVVGRAVDKLINLAPCRKLELMQLATATATIRGNKVSVKCARTSAMPDIIVPSASIKMFGRTRILFEVTFLSSPPSDPLLILVCDRTVPPKYLDDTELRYVRTYTKNGLLAGWPRFHDPLDRTWADAYVLSFYVRQPTTIMWNHVCYDAIRYAVGNQEEGVNRKARSAYDYLPDIEFVKDMREYETECREAGLTIYQLDANSGLRDVTLH